MIITSTDTINTITMPDPMVGDSKRLLLGTRFNLTLSGKTFTYKKGKTNRLLLFRFNNITETLKSDFITFAKAVKAKKVTLNQNSVTYTGVLLNDTIEITSNSNKLYDLTIQFEGKE